MNNRPQPARGRHFNSSRPPRERVDSGTVCHYIGPSRTQPRRFVYAGKRREAQHAKSMAEGPPVDHRTVPARTALGSAAYSTRPAVRFLETTHGLVGSRHLQYPGPRRVKVNLGPRTATSTAILRGGHGQAEAVVCWHRHECGKERGNADRRAEHSKSHTVSS